MGWEVPKKEVSGMMRVRHEHAALAVATRLGDDDRPAAVSIRTFPYWNFQECVHDALVYMSDDLESSNARVAVTVALQNTNRSHPNRKQGKRDRDTSLKSETRKVDIYCPS